MKDKKKKENAPNFICPNCGSEIVFWEAAVENEIEKINKNDSEIQLLNNEMAIKIISNNKRNKLSILLTNLRVILIMGQMSKAFNLSEIISLTQRRKFNGHISFLYFLATTYSFFFVIDLIDYLIRSALNIPESELAPKFLFGAMAGLFIFIKFFFTRFIEINTQKDTMKFKIKDISKKEIEKMIDEINKQREINNNNSETKQPY